MKTNGFNERAERMKLEANSLASLMQLAEIFQHCETANMRRRHALILAEIKRRTKS